MLFRSPHSPSSGCCIAAEVKKVPVQTFLNGPVSDEFDAWLTKAVESDPQKRNEALLNWEGAPSARLCHPPKAEEHLLPLMVAAGAASQGVGKKVFSDRVMETTLSAYVFE